MFFFRVSLISFSVPFIASSVLTTEANKRHISVCLSRTSAVIMFGLGSAARGAEGTRSLSAAWLGGSGSVGPLWGGDLADILLVPGSETYNKMYTHVTCVSLIICKKWCTVRVKLIYNASKRGGVVSYHSALALTRVRLCLLHHLCHRSIRTQSTRKFFLPSRSGSGWSLAGLLQSA